VKEDNSETMKTVEDDDNDSSFQTNKVSSISLLT
jgi:hypothetical protein